MPGQSLVPWHIVVTLTDFITYSVSFSTPIIVRLGVDFSTRLPPIDITVLLVDSSYIVELHSSSSAYVMCPGTPSMHKVVMVFMANTRFIYGTTAGT